MQVKKLTEMERFCLDGYAVNKNVDLAYILSRPTPTTTTDKAILHKMALRWLRSDLCRQYLQERNAALQAGIDSNEVEKRTNDDIISDLNKLLNKTTDEKLKAQMLVQLATLQGMKNKPQEESTSGDHRQYYLPLSCDMCCLYVVWKDYYKRNRKTSDLVTPQEWERLMQRANVWAKNQLDREGNERSRKEYEDAFEDVPEA